MYVFTVMYLHDLRISRSGVDAQFVMSAVNGAVESTGHLGVVDFRSEAKYESNIVQSKIHRKDYLGITARITECFYI